MRTFIGLANNSFLKGRSLVIQLLTLVRIQTGRLFFGVKRMKNALSLIALGFAALASSLALAEDLALSYSSIEAELSDSVALVFDSKSEELYGPLRGNKLQIKKLCEAVRAIAPQRPKVIVFDVELNADTEGAECLLQLSDQYGLNYVVYDEKDTAFRNLNEEQGKRIQAGYFNVFVRRNEDKSVREVRPQILPYQVAAFFIAQLAGMSDAEARSANYSLPYRIALHQMSESFITKVPYQDAIENRSKIHFGDKIVFVGVDQNEHDVFVRPDGEPVNGVFLHMLFLGAYRAAARETLPKTGMIYFK